MNTGDISNLVLLNPFKNVSVFCSFAVDLPLIHIVISGMCEQGKPTF